GSITVSGAVGSGLGNYTLAYGVSDGHGHTASATRTVHVVDTQCYRVVRNGVCAVALECPAVFTDPGATASDACAGDLTGSITVSGAVGSGLGDYTLAYGVSDRHGHTASATRTVHVVDTAPPVIACPANKTVTAAASAS